MKVLKSLARLKAMRLEEDEEPGRRKEVAVEKVKIAGVRERNARGCIDSGTTMAVRQMKDEEKELDRKEKLKERDAELATGKKVRVKENEKGTIVTVEAVQPLLPYVRALEMLKLKMREDEETGKLWIEHPTKGRLEVYTENGTLELDEDVILQLIEELEEMHQQEGATGRDEREEKENEAGKLVREMMDQGWTIEELAEKVREKLKENAGKADEKEETKQECANEDGLRSRGGEANKDKEELEKEREKWKENERRDSTAEGGQEENKEDKLGKEAAEQREKGKDRKDDETDGQERKKAKECKFLRMNGGESSRQDHEQHRRKGEQQKLKKEKKEKRKT